MMGPTIVFSIPVALGIIEPSDRRYLAPGVLAGHCDSFRLVVSLVVWLVHPVQINGQPGGIHFRPDPDEHDPVIIVAILRRWG